MSTNATQDRSSLHAVQQSLQAQKSRLLPSNRKLRHLQGVTLRNLSLSPSPQRHRGKTIDDEALPYSLKSPAKILAASERNQLAQSRSFTDFKSEAKSVSSNGSNVTEATTTEPTPTPKARQLPRRSTLDWANASPGQRQETLSSAISKRTASVFFTLHCKGVKDPVYISETVESSSNPNFRSFDLKDLGATLTRQDGLLVNFWSCTANESGWRHLLKVAVSLRQLQFLGRSLEEIHTMLPENCVIFQLQDGLYSDLSETIPTKLTDFPVPISNPGPAQPTSSYDALMRLATLDDCIQEAFATREKLTLDINQLIAQDKQRFFIGDAISGAQDSVSKVERAKETEKRQIKILGNRMSELRTNLSTRKELIRASAQTSDNAQMQKENYATELDTLQASHSAIQTPIRGQRRRICSDLSSIYPIEPIPDKSLLFTIGSLPLPNSNFSKSDISNKADTISAALGHTAHLTYLLSLYLSIALPYPIKPRSSTSTITDPISLSLTSTSSSASDDPDRTFPLYLSKSSPFYRFEYAVFLLNKDIELMSSKLGLRVMDIRQTLPNLKYIIFVATAGEGEVPSRKAGGVRGLLYASGQNEKDETPEGSRPGSIKAAENEVDIAFTLKKRLTQKRMVQNERRNGSTVTGSKNLGNAGKGKAGVN